MGVGVGVGVGGEGGTPLLQGLKRDGKREEGESGCVMKILDRDYYIYVDVDSIQVVYVCCLELVVSVVIICLYLIRQVDRVCFEQCV